jgi:nitrogen fixation protein NifU and related proteins
LFSDGECDRRRLCRHLDLTLGRSRLSRKSARRLNEGGGVCYGGRVARLYSDVILERFRHPRYMGELNAPDLAHEDVNPLCGDRIRIEVRLDGGAIAMASADLLAEMVEGRSLREAARVDRDTLMAALGAEIRPTRLRCVTLPLDILRTALAGSPAASDGPEAAGRRRRDQMDTSG